MKKYNQLALTILLIISIFISTASFAKDNNTKNSPWYISKAAIGGYTFLIMSGALGGTLWIVKNRASKRHQAELKRRQQTAQAENQRLQQQHQEELAQLQQELAQQQEKLKQQHLRTQEQLNSTQQELNTALALEKLQRENLIFTLVQQKDIITQLYSDPLHINLIFEITQKLKQESTETPGISLISAQKISNSFNFILLQHLWSQKHWTENIAYATTPETYNQLLNNYLNLQQPIYQSWDSIEYELSKNNLPDASFEASLAKLTLSYHHLQLKNLSNENLKRIININYLPSLSHTLDLFLKTKNKNVPHFGRLEEVINYFNELVPQEMQGLLFTDSKTLQIITNIFEIQSLPPIVKSRTQNILSEMIKYFTDLPTEQKTQQMWEQMQNAIELKLKDDRLPEYQKNYYSQLLNDTQYNRLLATNNGDQINPQDFLKQFRTYKRRLQDTEATEVERKQIIRLMEQITNNGGLKLFLANTRSAGQVNNTQRQLEKFIKELPTLEMISELQHSTNLDHHLEAVKWHHRELPTTEDNPFLPLYLAQLSRHTAYLEYTDTMSNANETSSNRGIVVTLLERLQKTQLFLQEKNYFNLPLNNEIKTIQNYLESNRTDSQIYHEYIKHTQISQDYEDMRKAYSNQSHDNPIIYKIRDGDRVRELHFDVPNFLKFEEIK